MKLPLHLQHSLCLGAILGSLCLATPARAQVNLLQTATVSQMPVTQIQLSWKSQGAGTVIQIYRRALGQEGGSTWGNPIATAVAPINSYADTGITPGIAYEYQLYCSKSGADVGYAFLAAGIGVSLVENRGKILLVVDQTLSAPLAAELTQLEQDLAGDGWTVIRTDSPRMTGASSGVDMVGQQNLKAWIQSQYNADPANVKAVFLFGRLPIVRSGWSIPDGHYYAPRVADVYYADMTGTWTDTDDDDSPSQGGGTNVPGDGKYDQDNLPNNRVDLQLGRVDLAEMTTWPLSEVELMRNYLRKDHNWRQGLITTPATGICENWDLRTEGYGLESLFGGASTVFAPMGIPLAQTQTTPYRWVADFGDYNGNDYFYRNCQAMFTINFGSFKQNWDAANNPMRDMLCITGVRLTD